jgi:YggT family protein
VGGVTVALLNFIDLLFQALSFAIIARALLSWFNLGPSHPLVRILYDITEPVLAPLRRVIPMIGMFDISPIVALILLDVIRRILVEVLLRAI